MQKPAKFKLKFTFLAHLIATHIGYLHSMSPMARLNWSAFLGVDLQPCKTMTDTLAPSCGVHQLGVTSLEFYSRPEWCPFGLVIDKWSGPPESNWWPRVFDFHLGVFASSLPTPHPSLPPTHLPTPL